MEPIATLPEAEKDNFSKELDAMSNFAEMGLRTMEARFKKMREAANGNVAD